MSMEIVLMLFSVLSCGYCTLLTQYNSLSLTEVPDNIPVDTTHLEMKSNSISVFEADTMSSLVALTSLDVSYNSLTQFPNLTHVRNSIREVVAQWNSISYIDPDLLDILSNIERINLERNSLDTFPNVAGPAGSLIELNLVANQFTQFPHLDLIGTSLRWLHLGNNFITEVSADDLKGLDNIELLHLYGNHISVYPDLTDVLDTLTVIWLNENGLNSVAADRFLFPDLSEGRSILVMLTDNNIETVPPPGGSVNNVALQLAGNPLVCDVMVSWMLEMGEVTWLLYDYYNDDPADDYIYTHVNPLRTTECSTPDSLSGKRVTDLTYQDLGIAAEFPADVQQTVTYASPVKQNYYSRSSPLSIQETASRVHCQSLCQPLKGCTFYNLKCSGGSCECHYSDPFYGQTRDTPTGGTDGWMYYYISQHTVTRN